MSRIEQLIDEIEEYVEGCKPAPFSQSKIIVQKEQLYELLTELRLKTPDAHESDENARSPEAPPEG